MACFGHKTLKGALTIIMFSLFLYHGLSPKSIAWKMKKECMRALSFQANRDACGFGQKFLSLKNLTELNHSELFSTFSFGY